jgi:cyclopropane fatty-acyl-phospholipid synthase-like methyltransferase
MAQTTTGVRSILSAAVIYDLFQRVVGADSLRATVASDYLLIGPHHRILDIGCGTAEILRFLPDDVEYVGFDASPEYIESARTRFGSRGTFFAKLVTDADLGALGQFDLVVAMSVLHHLSDPEAEHVFTLGARALADGGRMFTNDPCLTPGQSRIARAVIERDRGRNVRSPEGYRALAARQFEQVTAVVRHDMLHIPYSHALLTCAEPRA